MDRVVVVGSSGSGKTTVGRQIARVLGVPHLEMDSVMHQPGWKPLDDALFERRLTEFATGEQWVVDGNYTSHGAVSAIWPRADLVVWLDLPRALVMSRVIARTLRRVTTREELWNGNREPWTNLYSLDPYKNIIVWAWTRHGHVKAKYEECVADGSWAHADVHRLATPSEVEDFLASIERSASR